MAQNNLLYIGIAGHVLALDRATGEEAWRTPLKGSDLVNVTLADGVLYAGARGELYCLDPTTGDVRWNNRLAGLGWGLMTIAGADGNSSVMMRDKQRRDQEAANSSASVL